MQDPGLLGPAEAEEARDGLAALPSFRGKPRKRAQDPRRQSMALLKAFNAGTEGLGLLSGDEIALGDEDVQIPLDRGRLLGGAHNHSQLWVEPGMEDLASADLPSPELGTLIGTRSQGTAAGDDPDVRPPGVPRWCLARVGVWAWGGVLLRSATH